MTFPSDLSGDVTYPGQPEPELRYRWSAFHRQWIAHQSVTMAVGPHSSSYDKHWWRFATVEETAALNAQRDADRHLPAA